MVDDRTALMSARALSAGYEILWYTIDRVLGQGGFGITYLAHDRNLDRAVAIKEYLPVSFAYRHQDYSVKPITGDHRQNFVWGLGSFLKEAQTLARFSHPNIVRVHSVFEENNTAYMVMEYEHGQNLAAIYKGNENLEQKFFERVFFPIFDGLSEIHKFNFIHRDIKPANIYIRTDGTPVLIDFGSARQTTQQQTSEITALVSQGYTPLEQYSANYGDQGPWTDIYALAATIYEGVVGRKPDECLSRSACLMRSKPDLLEPLDAHVYRSFSQRFLNAVFAGLKLEPEGRPQSLDDWYGMFERGDDRFVSSPESTGFTELESDRTRLQPRRAAPEPAAEDFDSFTDLPSGSLTSNRANSRRFSDLMDDPMDPLAEPEDVPSERSERLEYSLAEERKASADSPYVQPRTETGFEPGIDLSSFDDDDLDIDSQARSRQRSSQRGGQRAGQRPGQTSAKKHGSAQRNEGSRSRRAIVVAAAAVMFLLVAGGGYYFYSVGVAPTGITVAALEKMPHPPQSTATVLPEENVSAQLAYMEQLAPLLAQAYELNAGDPTLLDTIRATEASLLSLAKQWNASNHAQIARQISAVSNALPVSVHDQSRIQGILSASGQVSDYTQVLALLDDKRYLAPAGESVLDRITAVSANDYQKLKGTVQWQDMMSALSSAALDKLSRSEFDAAARLTEAALTLDADEPGFRTLRSYLAGS